MVLILIFIKMQRQGDNFFFLFFYRTHIEFDHIYRKLKIKAYVSKKENKICSSTGKVFLVP